MTGMCDCPMAELYARAAKERDELRKKLEDVQNDRDELLAYVKERDARERQRREDRELLRDSNFEE